MYVSDVLTYIKSKNLQPVPQTAELPAVPPLPAKPTPPPSAKPVSAVTPAAPLPTSEADFTDIELSNMRSVIASRLTLSKVSYRSAAGVCSVWSLLCLHFNGHQGSHASWKVLDFFLENSRTWKFLENHFGPGKSWKLKLKVLESPGKTSKLLYNHCMYIETICK